ncbi:MAG TPA: AAA family ATPase [Candidatus Acidoferrum sp.]|jgi:Cdc6-like AAA superfamily ATPase|nr:AAA family ATPase [Candidatus Acidoferrum sp.]
MTDSETLEMKFRISSTFTPSTPIDKRSLFAGRTPQITKLVNAIAQRGQHAVLFGERGVGKTSLANVVKEFLTQLGEFVIVHTNCDTAANFRSIWTNIFSQISVEGLEVGMGFKPPTHNIPSAGENLISESPSPEEIRLAIQSIGKKAILIIDEVDRIKNPAVSAQIADTIKTLSDHAVDATLVLVGVADDVDTLIHEHRSIDRALIQIHMPRMSSAELSDIVAKGLNQLGMTINDIALRRISNLSHGLPHYTHSLALHASQSAIDRDMKQVNEVDVSSAIKIAISQAERSVMSDYNAATTSPRGNLYAEVLLACALAETDELGYFRAANVRQPMTQIMGRPYDIPAFSQHLNDFCERKRGPILQKTGWRKRYRFRFITPLMEPYVLMRGLSSGKIQPELLDSKLDQPIYSTDSGRLL